MKDNSDRPDGITDSERLRRSVGNLGFGYLGGGENRGYLGGFSDVIEKNVSNFDFYVLSNPDISLDFYEMIGELMHIKKRKKVPLIISPKIISSLTGMNQNPYMLKKPNRTKVLLFSILFRSRFVCGIYRYVMAIFRHYGFCFLRRGASPLEKEVKVYSGHGSFLIFSNDFFEVGGSLSMKNLLFCEEHFLGHEVEKLGGDFIYYPLIKVVHQEHASTGLFPSKKNSKLLATAHWTAFKEYYK